MTTGSPIPGPNRRHVSVVALPDGAVSTLFGVFDTMNGFARFVDADGRSAFNVDIVSETAGRVRSASGISIDVHRAIDTIDTTDIVIVPSVVLRREGWKKGRYPRLVDWVSRMHERGAVICSACSGIFLLAETGLFDGKDATVHFIYSREFAAAYPTVSIHPERSLVISGLREELVSSGASTTWHDLVLYLIARYAGATTAQEVARMFALQWHQDGLAPYIVFEGKTDHGDAEIESAQRWVREHFSVANPVEEMVKRSKLADRTFKRRFLNATGLTPLAYVQRLRVEEAKRRLERTEAPVDEISWRVGYEDPAFFRRLFKRTTGVAPGAYRKRFRIPDYARSVRGVAVGPNQPARVLRGFPVDGDDAESSG
ncbi:MAG TPA: helix-turn-helix domain-containing protein [Gemmatimonadaceae bacterium]|jgi:transcriptional regulator GlxA family with amidase domain|nr:helix-turn-helix domain-containing protein [Gemmatimonadaceae bacterium]